MVNYPIVPDLPGVPPMLRDPANIGRQVGNLIPGLPPSLLGHEGNLFLDNVLLLADNTGLFDVNSNTPRWGLFKDGNLVITADSVVALEFTQSYSLSDFPVEEGAFENYDKVTTPFSARIRFSSGGSEQNREQLLKNVADIAKTLELYDLQTPEVSYSDVNVIKFDYTRTARDGAALINVDVLVQEVRTASQAAFTNTKSVNGAATTDGGTVQTTTPTDQENDTVLRALAAEGLA